MSQKFCAEFEDYMSYVMTAPGKPLAVGDFSYHVNVQNDPEASEFLSVCDSFNLKQHITGPTHRTGNTLDLVFTRSDDTLISSSSARDVGFPDHYAVLINLLLENPKKQTLTVTYRRLKSVNTVVLERAITNTTIPFVTLNTPTLDQLIDIYQRELQVVLYDVAPEKTCVIPV